MNEFDPTAKLLAHPAHVAAFITGDRAKAPVSVEILPTNECNAKCPWCFYTQESPDRLQHKPASELPFSALGNCMLDLHDAGVESVVWSGGGEPSIYSRIDDAVDMAERYNIKQGMFTNGYKAIKRPEKLAWIRVTVTEKFTITKHVSEYAKKTKVGVNFNLCEENRNQMEPMLLAARDAGVAYFQVRPALAEHWQDQEIIDLPTELLKHQTKDFRVVLTPYKFDDYTKPHGYRLCHGHNIVPTIHANGDVGTCAYHYGKGEFVFGNIISQRWSEIWNGARRMKMLSDGIKVVNACQHCCKLHETNKVLATLAGDSAMMPGDVEFA